MTRKFHNVGKGSDSGAFSGAAGQTNTTGRVSANPGDTVNVVCAPRNKKTSFPWRTIFLTAGVATIGTVVATKLIKSFSDSGDATDKAQLNPKAKSTQMSLREASIAALFASPNNSGAAIPNPLTPVPLPAPALPAGPSHRELELVEREAVLRERLAEMEGFMSAQRQEAERKEIEEAKPKVDSLAALLAADD